MKNKTLISYFETYGNPEDLKKISRVNFSETDVNYSDIHEAIQCFENLKEICFRFGPFEKYFDEIPENMPHIILKDYSHGNKHLEFILKFAKNCKSVTFIENQCDTVKSYLRENSDLAKKFVFFDNKLVNIEHIQESTIEEKTLHVNINNIKSIPEDIFKRAKNIIFSGTPQEIETILKCDLKKIDSIMIVIESAKELSVKDLKKYVEKKKMPITQVQVYSKYNSTNQNIPYDLKTYMSIREKLDDFVYGIQMNWSEEKKFAEIYKRIALDISYDDENYEKDDINYKNSRNLINAIFEKKTVCAGYSEVLRNALDLLGIESVKVSGETLEKDIPHEWNKVKINGNWYNVDVTWDRGYLIYDKIPEFALKSDEEYKKTRTETIELPIPKADFSYNKRALERIFNIESYKKISIPIWDLSNWGMSQKDIKTISNNIVNNKNRETPYL